jgi:hypothetical protein
VPAPARVLAEIRRVLTPGAPVYVTEVMNASFLLDPYSPNVWRYWMAFNDFQIDSGGDPFVGAKLGNLLLAGGFRDVTTEIKTFHFDNREPARRKQMIAFWEELLLSAADQLLSAGREGSPTTRLTVIADRPSSSARLRTAAISAPPAAACAMCSGAPR